MLLAYRSTIHSSTGFGPAYLHGGQELRVPAQVVFPARKDEREPLLVNDYVRRLRLNLKNVFRDVSLNLQRSHEITKDRSQHYPRYRP